MKKPKPTREMLKEFIELPSVAFVGVSADPKRFGSSAFGELKQRGWKVIPVNPKYESVQGETCYRDLKSIPEKVDGVISVVTKANTLSIVEETHALGIKHIWVQQMSETPEAIAFSTEKEMKAIYGECILMYYPPVKSFHGFHRWMKKIFTFNKMP